jgi:hypothetical protein
MGLHELIELCCEACELPPLLLDHLVDPGRPEKLDFAQRMIQIAADAGERFAQGIAFELTFAELSAEKADGAARVETPTVIELALEGLALALELDERRRTLQGDGEKIVAFDGMIALRASEKLILEVQEAGTKGNNFALQPSNVLANATVLGRAGTESVEFGLGN